MWQVVEKDMLGREAYDRRYGIGRYHGKVCYNCKQKGHLQTRCPNPPKMKPCHICGEFGHKSDYCPSVLCTHCTQPKHFGQIHSCNESLSNLWNICQRCLMFGHEASKCPEIWRQHHNTTDGNHGHSLGHSQYSQKQSRRLFCYNCAQRGHFGYECSRERPKDYPLPSCPLIKVYDRPHTTTTYTNVPTSSMRHQETRERRVKRNFACLEPYSLKRPRVSSSGQHGAREGHAAIVSSSGAPTSTVYPHSLSFRTSYTRRY